MMKKGIYSVRMMWLRKANYVGWFRIRHVCEFREMVDDSRFVVKRMTRFWVRGRKINVSECVFPSH